MMGCTRNASTNRGTASQRLPARIAETAMRISAVARFRGCGYWSANVSAVPATGNVNMAATIATAPHCAGLRAINCRAMLPQAVRIRNREMACHKSSDHAVGMPVQRTKSAIHESNCVACS